MVSAAADGDSVFLQGSQTRQGFSCVGDLGFGVFDQLYRFIGGGGNAGHMLQDIQRGTLAL